jgi:hypothetical protein
MSFYASTPVSLAAVEAIAECDSQTELIEIQSALNLRMGQLAKAAGIAMPTGPGRFRIGEPVEFTISRGRQRGRIVRGKVHKINRKTVGVLPDVDPSQGYVQLTGKWRVPPSMLRKINP